MDNLNIKSPDSHPELCLQSMMKVEYLLLLSKIEIYNEVVLIDYIIIIKGGFIMYDIFEAIRNEAEKRNLRERTIQLYCSNVSYFLRCIGKPVSELTLDDAENFLTTKCLEV